MQRIAIKMIIISITKSSLVV